MEVASSSETAIATNIHVAIFASLHVISLHLVVPLLPVSSEGLQNVCHFSWSRSIVITAFHSIPLCYKIFFIPSSQVCRGLPPGLFPCVLACQAILGYLSSPILVICPHHRSCANSIMASYSCRLDLHERPSETKHSAFLDSFNDTS